MAGFDAFASNNDSGRDGEYVMHATSGPFSHSDYELSCYYSETPSLFTQASQTGDDGFLIESQNGQGPDTYKSRTYEQPGQRFLHALRSYFGRTKTRFRRSVLRSGPAYLHPQDQEDQQTPGRFTGWRGGVRASCIGVAICLAIEIILMAVVLKLGIPDGGLGTLYKGDCNYVRNLIIYLLIPLNVIGTISIGSSNYVMQCLMAPNRKEVDAAHAQGLSTTIGISSMHNMGWLSGWKNLTWWILGLSTAPIHLLLNSTVFSTLQANNYGVVIASQGFLQDTSWDLCPSLTSDNATPRFVCNLVSSMRQNSTKYTRLDPEECISRYANPLQDTSSNVVLVTNNTSTFWANLGNGGELPSQVAFDPNDGDLNISWTVRQRGSPDQSMFASSSNGLFTMPSDNLWEIPSFRGVFTAFDFRRWTIAQMLDYNQSEPQAIFEDQWNPATWLCDTQYTMAGGECSANAVVQNATKWEVSPASFVIDHCLSEPSVQQCTAQYSLHILLILIGCDIVKLTSTAFILRSALMAPESGDQTSLATIGDAIASFLEVPDETSAGRCLIDAKRTRALHAEYTGHGYHWDQLTLQERIKRAPAWFGPRPLPFKAHKQRWLSIPSRTRRFFFAMLYIGIIASGGVITSFGIENLTSLGISPLQKIWDQGIGMDPNALFTNSYFGGDGSTTILRDTVVINTPQLLFSFLYFMYNGLFTNMMIGHEWSLFSTERRTLRVSNPKYGQRWTYWLSLPWRYSIPLVGVSSGLHWLVSRSLFLVKINVYDRNGNPEPERDISACGFSPLAILLVMVILTAMLVVLLVYGMRSLALGIPVAGANSWAISAACHYIQGDKDEDAALKPLKWGVVVPASEGQPGHCCITSQKVEAPIEGQIYL